LDSIAPPGASHAVGSFSQPKGSFECQPVNALPRDESGSCN